MLGIHASAFLLMEVEVQIQFCKRNLYDILHRNVAQLCAQTIWRKL